MSSVVLGLFIGNFDFEFVVLELFLLSFDLNTEIEELFFESRLVLFECRLLGLFRDETFLNLDGSREYFIDEFFTLLSQHFELNLLLFFGLDLFEEVIVYFLCMRDWVELW